VNKNDPRCIEIWNLVFIQFNAQPVAGGGYPGQTEYVPLAARHVDTGMGFERAVAIIQGTKNLSDFSGTISNYETDVFRPIFDEIEKLSGKKCASLLPIVGRLCETPAADTAALQHQSEQQKIDIAFRVIADHIRALSFAIADGIIPSNEGRGYVLRRILRRAIRYGRSLGFHEPFFFKLVDVVAKTMGDVFPEVRAKQKPIEETIRREEESFNKTLDTGLTIFEEAASFYSYMEQRGATDSGYMEAPDEQQRIRGMRAVRPKKSPEGRVKLYLDGEFLFFLYDTYGFPIDLTELLARERGIPIDSEGFEVEMEKQRERARAAQKKSAITVHHVVDFPTRFVGYDRLEADAKLFKIIEKAGGTGSGDKWAIVDVSPLYAESGGQVGDTGELKFIEDGKIVRVTNTLKENNTFYLKLGDVEGFDWTPEALLNLRVDAARRRAIQGHHTVTHLLHWALHEIVSRDASQKGSYVGPDKLTFDFSSAPLTPEQKRDVERLVNQKITENSSVSWTEIPFTEAKQRKEIIQFFGEKYGETVRVLQIGGAPHELNGYSMELCGGTHVKATGEIGPFRIIREEAIAAGTRRIEAVAGDAARAWAMQEAAQQQDKFQTLARKQPDIAPLPAFQDDAPTAEMLKQIDARAAHLEKIDAEVREWEKKTAKSAEAELKSRAAQIAGGLAQSHAGKNFCLAEVPDADGKLLQAIVDALKSKFKGPIFLVGSRDASVALVVYVPNEFTSRFQANKLIQQIAPIVGGKGGGRPESAQGAGKDASKVAEALSKAKELLS